MNTNKVKIIILFIAFISLTMEHNCSVKMSGDLDYDSLKIDSKLNINFNYEDSNSLTIDFKYYEYENPIFQRDNFSFGEIYYQTYHEIQENHGYMSGKAFIILSNGTRIQTHDIKLNSDSTFEVFYIKHNLNAKSSILEMTEYPVKHIEFEVYYFKSMEGKKILLSKSNEIGLFKSNKPFSFKNNLKEFFKDSYNLEYKGSKLDLPLSEILGDGDCEFDSSYTGTTTKYHLNTQFEILDPKNGYVNYFIETELNSDFSYSIEIYSNEENYTRIERGNSYRGRLVLEFILSNNDRIILPNVDLNTKKMKSDIIKIKNTKQSDFDKYLSLMDENIISLNIRYYNVKEILVNDEYKVSLFKEYNAIVNEISLKNLEPLKMYFACLIMKINKIKIDAQRNTKR